MHISRTVTTLLFMLLTALPAAAQSENEPTDVAGGLSFLLWLLSLGGDQSTDSVATTDAADTAEFADNSRGIVEGTMAETYEILGRVNDSYTNSATAQPDMRTALNKSDRPTAVSISNRKSVFIDGRNNYTANGIPSTMRRTLDRLKQQGSTINDVCITDMGWWAVVYDGNRYEGELPESLRSILDKAVARGETILSVSISDDGDYAYATSKRCGASNDIDNQALEQAVAYYGQVSCVSVTPSGLAATCERGLFLWGVPDKVYNDLNGKDFTPSAVRYTDSGTYIAVDGRGKAYWNM